MKRWLQPRLLGLHAAAVFVVAACVWMGFWQLGVYGSKHEDAAESARSAAPLDILKVWGPDDAFRPDLVGQRVRIEGRFSEVPSQSLFKVNRPDGEKWFATTVRVRGTKSSILVVLGHERHLTDIHLPRPPYNAILQPPEPTGDLSIAQRVNESHGDLFSGYALLDEPSYRELRPVRPPDPRVSWTVGFRNLAYALQWWVFGVFTGFMWWRMATDIVDVDSDVGDARVI